MPFESLKIIPEHLVERIKLDETTGVDLLGLISSFDLHSNYVNMNNNLCPTMFLMNDGRPMQANSNHQAPNMSGKKHDVGLFNLAYDKGTNFEAANSFFRSGIFTADKNFLSSRGHVQLTAQECGELFLKKITESNHLIGTEVTNIASLVHPNSNMFNVNNISNEHQLNTPGLGASTKNSVSTSTAKALPGKSQTFRVEKDRPYSCTQCSKSFVLKHHLVTHTRLHSGERPHICTECGKSFAHKHCLSTHLLLHSSQRPYQCLDCKKNFTLKHHLVTHSRVHSRDRPYVCQECMRSFPQKRHLVTHAKFHSGERPFVCDICSESFAQKEHLLIHSRFHGGQHSYVCSFCEASFARKFELVNHERLHGREPHKCNFCSKEFLQKRTLLAHVRLHEDRLQAEERAGHNCPQCGEMFADKSELAEHAASHATSHAVVQEKPYNCRNYTAVPPHFFCATQQAPARNPATTSSAVQTDTVPKAKPHVCSDCGKAFMQKHGLAQHNKRHLGGEGCDVRTHVCPKCNKAFYQHNHLVLHSRQHIPVPVKKEECDTSSNHHEQLIHASHNNQSQSL